MLDTKHLKEQGSHWSWGQSCPLLWAVTDVHDGPRASRTAAISVSYLPRESPTTCSLTRSSLKLALFAANSFSFFKVKSNFYNIHINKGNNMVLDKTSPYSLTAEISPKDFKFTGKKKKAQRNAYNEKLPKDFEFCTKPTYFEITFSSIPSWSGKPFLIWLFSASMYRPTVRFGVGCLSL